MRMRVTQQLRFCAATLARNARWAPLMPAVLVGLIGLVGCGGSSSNSQCRHHPTSHFPVEFWVVS